MIKKGNQVQVICGKDKGKKGDVIETLISKSKVKVKFIKAIIGDFPSLVIGTFST